MQSVNNGNDRPQLHMTSNNLPPQPAIRLEKKASYWLQWKASISLISVEGVAYVTPGTALMSAALVTHNP